MKRCATTFDAAPIKDIKCKSAVVSHASHSDIDLLAILLYNGKLKLSQYKNIKGSRQVAVSKIFDSADCGRVCIFNDTNELYCASKDASIVHISVAESGIKSVKQWSKAHDEGISCLCSWKSNIFVSGDDNGVVKLWDKRKQGALCSFSECEEPISALQIDETGRHCLAASSEGTLTCFDLRKKAVFVQSEIFESELTSLQFLRNGTKLVSTSLDGVMHIFNQGEYSNFSDRFPVVKNVSLDCSVKINDKLVAVGCGDGEIRLVNILPNKLIGSLGNQGKGDFVTDLSISHDGKWLMSSGWCNYVKFWDVSKFQDSGLEESHDIKQRKSKLSKKIKAKSFFEDIDKDPFGLSKGDVQTNSDNSDESDDSNSDTD